MSWAKNSDTTAFHPRVMRLGSIDDPRLLNEAWGFVHRALTWSGAHYTDGFVPDYMAAQIAGPTRYEDLTTTAVRAKLLRRQRTAGEPGWLILQETDDLMHIRSKEEVDWERRHRAQLRDPEQWVPVRVRDGDACRYCSRVVKWNDNKSDRGATLDHVDPDGDELVVACRACNGKKQDRTPEAAGLTLLPAPVEPYYSPATVSRLARYGVTVPVPSARTQPPQQGQREPQHQARDAAPQGAHAADRVPTVDPSSVSGQPHRIPPGRDGTGLVGSGLSALPPPTRPPRSRGSRGKRKPPPTRPQGQE